MIYCIAEVGINHNGSIEIAKQLIRSAAEAGFDAVKFQKRTIDLVYSKEFLASPRESPWGTTQRDQKEGLEFNLDQYLELIGYCREMGIEWSASCWDIQSQEFVNSLKPDFQKIASPMNTHHALIEKACEGNKKIFMSTGMSTQDEISDALNIIRRYGNQVELMHCNSSYPLDEKNANLARMQRLKKEFGLNVGYSGHETCLDRVCIAAVVLGATSIERHITLDRAMYGSDQSASVGVHALRKLISGIRLAESYLGSDDISALQHGEEEGHKKLKYKIAA